MKKSFAVAAVTFIALCTISLSTFAQSNAKAPLLLSPRIVVSGKLLNQTAPLPFMTIYTPKTDGVYRLTMYATQLTVPVSAGYSVTAMFYDASGAANQTDFLNSNGIIGAFGGSGTGIPGATVVMQVKASTPISFEVTSSADENSTYSVYYTLERLQ